jgi:hypothetical protein
MINLAAGYAFLIRPMMGGVGFESPGSVVVEADGPGDWTVLHQAAGVFEGRRREANARDAKGLSVAVTQVSNGSPVAFEPDDSFSMTVGSTRRETVGRFTADAAGAYRIEAGGNARPVVLFAARWSTSVPFATVGTLALVQIVAIGLGIVGVNRLIRNRRARAAVEPAPV